jgi:hypothetical protein
MLGMDNRRAARGSRSAGAWPGILTGVLEATGRDPQVKTPAPGLETGSHPSLSRRHGQPAPTLARHAPGRHADPSHSAAATPASDHPQRSGIFTPWRPSPRGVMAWKACGAAGARSDQGSAGRVVVPDLCIRPARADISEVVPGLPDLQGSGRRRQEASAWRMNFSTSWDVCSLSRTTLTVVTHPRIAGAT